RLPLRQLPRRGGAERTAVGAAGRTGAARAGAGGGLRLQRRVPGLRGSGAGGRRRTGGPGHAEGAGPTRAGTAGRAPMSVSLDRLRALMQQACGRLPGAAPPQASPAPHARPAQPTAPGPGSPAPPPVDRLRRLLGVRDRAPAYAAATHPVDRSLPGREIAPGLRLVEAHLPQPIPRGPLPLGFARRGDQVDPGRLLFFDTETTGL